MTNTNTNISTNTKTIYRNDGGKKSRDEESWDPETSIVVFLKLHSCGQEEHHLLHGIGSDLLKYRRGDLQKI